MHEPTPAPVLLSAEDLARMTGFSLQRVWFLARTGLLPSVRAGRRIYFSRAAVEAWLSGETAGQAS